MGGPSIIFQNVSFAYEGAGSRIFSGLNAHFPQGWSGVAGPNGSGKTTILRLCAGELIPTAGRIEAVERAIYCPQRTDHAPPLLSEFLENYGGDAMRLKGLLHIDDDWPGRWTTLSHGERKRAQIGSAIWRRPLVLAVDEPTNHLDREARQLIRDALSSFEGVGIVVSHDRELLDLLCLQVLFVDPPEAVMRPGGYRQGLTQAQLEQEEVQHRLRTLKTVESGIRREETRRRRSAASSRQRLSKRGIDAKDHDGRAKKDQARLTGKDKVDGKVVTRLAGRRHKVQDEISRIKINKSYDGGIWLVTSPARRRTVFTLPAGELNLTETRVLEYPGLALGPTDRVGIVGPNGAGKSRLITAIVNSLDLPEERVVYLPQEIDLTSSQSLLEEAKGLSSEELGRMMTAVSCLGSRPERLLASHEPSPGEIRKLILAMGISRAPHLIIMDEPTNHLDITSITSLEQVLSDCPCALLLVSHDLRFLENLGCGLWRIDRHGDIGRLTVT